MKIWRRWLEPVRIEPGFAESAQLTALLWLLVGVLFVVLHVAAGRFVWQGLHLEITNIFATSLAGWLISLGLVVAFMRVREQARWYVALYAAFIVTVATMLMWGADLVLARLILDIGKPLNPTVMTTGALFYFMTFGVNLALIWITASNRALRLQSERLALSEAENLRAEVANLRLKLNPHFMFNALVSASHLVEMDRKTEGVQMLERLGSFLRASFDVGEGDIALDEELSIIGDYLAVESVRFSDRMTVRFDIDPDVGEVRVPSFLLQPLVENAVKHAVAPSMEPVCVVITAAFQEGRLALIVEDDGVTPPRPGARRGLGLSTTRSRLKMRYGDSATLEAGPTEAGYRVRIDLPR